MRPFARSFGILGTAVITAITFSACASGGEELEEEGAGAAITTKCQINNIKAGRAMNADDLKKLNDPIAKLVLAGEDCPTTYDAMTAKLKKTDNKDCSGGGDGDTAGMSTALVSETAQASGAPTNYRAVHSRECGGRGSDELLVSIFGVQANGPLPQSFEAIGKDATTGVYNYYAREDNEWKFFGNSLDLIGDGYNCTPNGACQNKAAAKTRCAGCHTSGGLIMKELESPWVHWEGDTTTPGAAEYIQKHQAKLGSQSDGISLEGTVASGNDAYNAKRLAFLKTKGTQEVLRPLFCTLETNLVSASASGTLSSMSTDLLLSRQLNAFASLPVKHADYLALLKANGQRIEGVQNNGKQVLDTFFAFTFPRKGNVDDSYIQSLVSEGIIDDDFVKDVLSVDMTRPIFSGQRCNLLRFAPNLDASKMKPADIKNGFKANLASASEPAAKELLAFINDANDGQKHEDAANAYLAACAARPQKDFLKDAMAIASHVRNEARKLNIMEFPESMVIDNAPTDKAFDPATCTLK